MTRLKDADSLIEKLNTFNDHVHGDTHFICGIESAKEIIQNEPTVDAVPVKYIEEFIEKHRWVGLGNYICSADSANRCWVMKEFLKEWRNEQKR